MLLEGLAEGLAEAVAVGLGELGWPLLEGRGAGLGFTRGGALVVEGGREVGGSLRVGVGTGRRMPSLFRSWTPFRAGCVVTRTSEVGESETGPWSSSGDGPSGIEAARGAVDWGSTDAVARPPRMVKAAAARDRTAYFFNRGGRLRAADRSGAGGADPGSPAEPKGGSPSGTWTFAIAVSSRGAPPV